MTEGAPVTRSALGFDPTFPWVYWCDACRKYIDFQDVRDHILEMKQNRDHPSVVSLERVDVV